MSSESTILFRPSKKRKIYRQRDSSPDAEVAPNAAAQSIDELIASASVTSPTTTEVESVPVPVSEILRLRKNKKRIGGVEFKASGLGIRDEDGGEEGGGEVEKEGEEVQAGGLAARRFAPQMGIVGEAVDRHMMAYIDSEIAKRRLLETQNSDAKSQAEAYSQTTRPVQSPGEREGVGSGAGEKNVQKQPATLGKLQEIDLGDEVRERNREETERARRRLDGETVIEEVKKGNGKVRLGRDGKPWRGRKRRGSDDVKRDQLVEAVLRENRLEIYDEPIEEPASVNDDQAADDRMAEQFRKDFLDAVSARQAQKKKAAPAQPASRNAATKKEEELMKGPKLGGSRSARAAMRENMLKAAKK